MTKDPVSKAISMVEVTGAGQRPQIVLTFENLDEMHDASDRLRELRTPQGEPALTQSAGLLGTREPAVIEPKGNTGESPASTSSKDVAYVIRKIRREAPETQIIRLTTEEALIAADEIERLRGPGSPTQMALDAITKPLHVEIERLTRENANYASVFASIEKLPDETQQAASNPSCSHASIKRDTHGWRCDDCLRVFFPSGDTGAEQECVRLRAAMNAIRAKLAEYLERLLQKRTLPNRWVGEINEIVSEALSQSSAVETAARRSTEGLIFDGADDVRRPVDPILGTDKMITDGQLKMLVEMDTESLNHRAFIELWERRGSPLEPDALPESLRDPIKNLESGRELLKQWGPTPVTDAALAESKESPLARAVRIARGDVGPPTEPVRFSEKASCTACEGKPEFPNIPCSLCGRYPDGSTQ